MRHCLPALLLGLAACSASSTTAATRFVPMQKQLNARFGEVAVKTNNRAGIGTLELTLSDPRFHGEWPGFVDTARTVARVAAGALPADYHPDSITVKIMTAGRDLGVVSYGASSSATFAVAALQ